MCLNSLLVVGLQSADKSRADEGPPAGVPHQRVGGAGAGGDTLQQMRAGLVITRTRTSP